MRKKLKSFLPDHNAIQGNRWLRPFASTLLHPRLWHLNRHSAAGAVAVGLFCGLIPGPLQMLAAAILCVVLRLNLPLALLCTLYSNPLTIVPLYVVAFALGNFAMGHGAVDFIAPPDLSGLGAQETMRALLDWMAVLGEPLAVGLVLLAALLAALGYVAVRGLWRMWLVRKWRQRRNGGNGGNGSASRENSPPR